MKKISTISLAVLLLGCALLFALPVRAQEQPVLVLDSDGDGLTDQIELTVYHTDIHNPDTDGDGYSDGDEVRNNYDPNKAGDDKLDKIIRVSLADQSLAYGLGDYIITSFKISSGLPRTPTPLGEYEILQKKPVVNYFGVNYSYPNTKWNLMFKKGKTLNYYIHGAYWHNDFGKPKSHGCVNVSYANMEGLYNWADVGTKLVIK